MNASIGGVVRLTFTEADIQQMKKLAELYTQAKGLIIYSEEIDPESRSNLQVIKELRDANDHLMRVIAARLADEPPSGASEHNYCSSNLDKAIGHVYRAAFDALDGTILSLREKVATILESYPREVIQDVIPEYWTMRISLDKLTGSVATNRASKDVGADICATLEQYVKDAEIIKQFYLRLLNAGSALDECQIRQRKEEKTEHSHHLWIHVKAGVIYSVIIGASVAASNQLLKHFWPTKDVGAQQQPLLNQLERTSDNEIAPLSTAEKTNSPKTPHD